MGNRFESVGKTFFLIGDFGGATDLEGQSFFRFIYEKRGFRDFGRWPECTDCEGQRIFWVPSSILSVAVIILDKRFFLIAQMSVAIACGDIG